MTRNHTSTETSTDASPSTDTAATKVPRAALLATLTCAVLLTAMVVGAALSDPWTLPDTPPTADTPTIDTPAPAPLPTPPPPLDELEPREGMPTPLRITILGLVALAVAVYALILLRALSTWLLREIRARRAATTAARSGADPTDGTPARATTVPDLEHAVTDALARMAGATTSTDAVIAAWLALEDAAGAHGTTRTAAQTPTEFTLAVLRTTPASPDAVHGLLDLYHQARFTQTPTTPDQVTAARDHLHRLTGDLSPRDTPRDAP
ncbi:DUF4129 domain-containing protein [Sanguibacter suaedae]|uniref:DUF4129 domain-containing protein n=1 Tax=Sanguibacter suaedae TaxID=2795737 RepID=A0A934I6F5_9MICO|nr:DUF4129 domain-containing protein [Sanguibacter suaedae]MBI9116163.1 DUF4129 domain-containing protein [Sanguibacter suaedae]